MTPRGFSVWPSQSPPPDFAERAVAAISRDRSRRARGLPTRRIAAIAIAAVLVVGGAWARVAVPRAPKVTPAPAITGTRTTVLDDAPAVERAVSVREAAPEPMRSPVTPAPPRRPRNRLAAPDAGRVRVPMCNCTQTICDCGEEP
jgi:hypothetical protein